jgi:hypothetical protein
MNRSIAMSASAACKAVASDSIEEINHIRGLRKLLREPVLSETTVKAIEVIHGCLKTGTDVHGWRKVDWKPRSGGSNNHRSVPIAFERRAAGGAGASSAPVHTGPPVRYVSKFKQAGAEKVDDTILNTIILGKLNKFSAGNYNEIKDFLCQILDSGETDFLRHFMLLVFQKAAGEEFFCPLYAKLLSELSSKYTILLSEMAALYGEYLLIFEEVDESSAIDYNDFVKRTEQKKYRLGYSQFLAELIKHGTVNTDLFMKTIQTILKHLCVIAKKPDSKCICEEYADCIAKIVKAIEKSDSNESVRSIRKAIVSEMCNLEPFTKKNPENVSLSNKARFALLDIYEAVNKFK